MPGLTRHHELASLLKEHGWRTEIYSTPFNHKTSRLDRAVSAQRMVLEQDEQGVPFIWVYSLPYASNGLRRYLNMVSYSAVAVWAGLVRPKPSIIVGSSSHLLAGLSAWLVARRHKLPFVLEVRDLWPDSLVQLGLTNPFVIKPLAVLETFLYRRSVAVIALTEGIRDGVIAKGVPANKVVLIPNATTRPAPLDVRQRTEERRRRHWEGKTVAVWVGAHGPANGLEHVVDAARLLTHRTDIVIAFVGDGPDKGDLMRRSAGLENVEFHDPIPKEQVSDTLRAADIGILHSRAFQAFTGARPNKLFDYMAAGLPIVCALPGEALGLVNEAGAGICAEWENARSIAGAIVKLADCQELRDSLGGSGFRYVAHRHSRENTAVDLNDLLLRLIAQSQASKLVSAKNEVSHA